jgi:hypothetical protein
MRPDRARSSVSSGFADDTYTSDDLDVATDVAAAGLGAWIMPPVASSPMTETIPKAVWTTQSAAVLRS